VRLSEDARQSDQNQQPKQCLCRAFIEAHDKGAIYCRAFLGRRMAKTLFAVRFSARRTANSPCLPCVFQAGARQRTYVCRTPGAKRTAKGVPRRLAPVPLVVFLPCVLEKRTAKIVYHALSDVAHDKGALPCKMLPCAFCRAPRRKTPCVLGPLSCARGARQSRGFP
jgi:hypothetical protein